ncbi:transposon Ty3-I Gag-Pol polyprotein [Trichonephila clavipes]|nr:transposon Ty3-I Gag-Pol polyprotein [Trichonephila clavipes]
MHCRECQRRKSVPQKPPGLLIQIPPAWAPFQRVGIDLLGRFPRSTKGNKWIIICTDYLPRFAFTKALPTADAEEVAKFITEEIVLKHGTPRTILTNRGKVFKSKLVKELCQLCISKHRKMTGYHSHTNGLNESADGSEDDYVSRLVTRAEESRQLARIRTLEAQHRDKTRYDARQQSISYRPDELVCFSRLLGKLVMHVLRMERYTPEAQERILTNDTKKLPSNALAGATYNIGMDKKDTTLDSPGEIVPYRGLMMRYRKWNVKEL